MWWRGAWQSPPGTRCQEQIRRGRGGRAQRGRQAGQDPDSGLRRVVGASERRLQELDGFLKDKIEPGSHILTDGWNGYWHASRTASSTRPPSCPSRTSRRINSSLGSTSPVQPETLPARDPPHRRKQTPQTIRRRIQLPASTGRTMEQDLLTRLLRALPRNNNRYIQTTYRLAGAKAIIIFDRSAEDATAGTMRKSGKR